MLSYEFLMRGSLVWMKFSYFEDGTLSYNALAPLVVVEGLTQASPEVVRALADNSEARGTSQHELVAEAALSRWEKESRYWSWGTVARADLGGAVSGYPGGERGVYGPALLWKEHKDLVALWARSRFFLLRHSRPIVEIVGDKLGVPAREMFAVDRDEALLAWFKHDVFFTGAMDWIHWLPQDTAFPGRDDLIMPLGISFYTFQTLSYILDVYRKRIEPCRDLLEFSLFVSFFPQLIAGPIMRAGDLIPQIRNQRRTEQRDILIGVELFCVGAFKKVVIADNVARLSDACFGAPGDWTGGPCAGAGTASWECL